MSSRQGEQQPYSNVSPQVAYAAQQAQAAYRAPQFQEVTQGVYDEDIPF